MYRQRATERIRQQLMDKDVAVWKDFLFFCTLCNHYTRPHLLWSSFWSGCDPRQVWQSLTSHPAQMHSLAASEREACCLAGRSHTALHKGGTEALKMAFRWLITWTHRFITVISWFISVAKWQTSNKLHWLLILPGLLLSCALIGCSLPTGSSQFENQSNCWFCGWHQSDSASQGYYADKTTQTQRSLWYMVHQTVICDCNKWSYLPCSVTDIHYPSCKHVKRWKKALGDD